MAGKSGRSINNVPENPMKHIIFSWEGILVILFILVNIFCASFSEFYNLKSVLRQMPVYLAEVFMMFPMAYILVLGEIDISVGAIVCLSATLSCMVCNTNAPFIVVVLTALVVGALCGAVNGFILTRFKELPPMIVTLATQIIFRGIAEVTLGAGGSIAITNTDGFRAIGGKVGHAQQHKDNAGGAVQGLRRGFVGKYRRDPRPDQREHHAQGKHCPVRCAADGKVRDSTGQRGEGHDEHTGAHGGFQLVAQHAGQDQRHHHAAARTHEAADKADQNAAHNGLNGALLGGNALHGLLGGHNGADDELDAQQEGHEYGEASHGVGGEKAGNIAAHHGEQKHRRHHDKAVAHVQIPVFMIGVGGDGAGQHVGGQSDAYRHVGVHAQKCDEHGTDDRRGAHARKAGAEACAHAGEKGDEKCDDKFHF